MVVLDSRHLRRVQAHVDPDAASDVPGGELAYRVARSRALAGDADRGELRRAHALDPRRGEPAARRRSQSRGGAAQRHDGMGAGRFRVRTRTHRAFHARPAGHAAALAIERARAFAESCGVGVIGALDLARFEEDPDRTCYVLDVRDPAEYRRRAPPGQPLRAGRAARAGDRSAGSAYAARGSR